MGMAAGRDGGRSDVCVCSERSCECVTRTHTRHTYMHTTHTLVHSSSLLLQAPAPPNRSGVPGVRGKVSQPTYALASTTPTPLPLNLPLLHLCSQQTQLQLMLLLSPPHTRLPPLPLPPCLHSQPRQPRHPLANNIQTFFQAFKNTSPPDKFPTVKTVESMTVESNQIFNRGPKAENVSSPN